MTAAPSPNSMLDQFDPLPLPQMGAPASGRRWRLRPAEPRIAAQIAQEADLDPVLARALAARGPGARRGGRLSSSVHLRDSMPDPHVLMDMERAAQRLAQAVIAQETIGVFGDYDVDGTTAAAILKRYFSALGARLETYLPDRLAEGYGPHDWRI